MDEGADQTSYLKHTATTTATNENNNDNNNNSNNHTERRKSRFYTLLTPPQTASNTYAKVARTLSCTSHVQHIEHLSRAICYVSLGMKGQLSY